MSKLESLRSKIASTFITDIYFGYEWMVYHFEHHYYIRDIRLHSN